MAQLSFPGRMMGPRHGGASAPTNPGFFSATANGGIPNGALALPGGKPSSICRFPLYFGWAPKDSIVRIIVDNFRVTSSSPFVIAPGSGTRTVRKMALEKSDASTFVPVTYDAIGTRTKTLASLDFDVTSFDVVLPWAVAQDDFVWVRCALTHQTASQNAPAVWGRMTSDSQQYEYATANYIDQVDGTGVLTAPTAATDSSIGPCLGPSFIIAKPVDQTNFISVVTCGGDSLVTDGGDIDTVAAPAFIPMPTGTTYYGRGASFNGADGATPVHVLALSRCSTTGAQLHTTYGAGVPGQQQLYAMKYGNIGYAELQINDLIGNVTATTCKTDYRTLLATMRAQGMRTMAGQVMPRTSGAWTLADGSDQSFVSTVGSSGGPADQLNLDRQSMLGGLVDAIVPVNSGFWLASDHFKCNADGGVNTFTHDGLHPWQAVGNVPIVPYLRAGVYAAQYRGARTDVAPTAAELTAIYNLIYALESGTGIWYKLDALYILSVATAQAACINLVNPFGPDTLQQLGSPTFTPGLGFTGDGAGARLAMATNASALAHFKQDSACYGVAISAIGSGTNPGALDMGTLGTTGSSRVSVQTTLTTRARINTAGADVTAVTADGRGLMHVNRTGAGAQAVYQAGVSIGSNSTASDGVVAAPFTILSAISASSSDTANAAYVGASLSDADILTLYTAIKTCVNTINGGTIIP